ncbi:MAG: hypothetical protein ICV58_04660, partial [Rubrobacteraceae bacterium]|nr:hypothetical protein [Rubrobacteraceae bacterium]
MRDDQGVACMVAEILTRRAKARAPRIADSFEDALELVLGTETSRRLRELGSSARRRERVDEWQANVAREQAEVLGWRSPRETP